MKTVIALIAVLVLSGCDSPVASPPPPPVHKVTADVPVNESGHTVEQENIARRLANDNKPGAIKHLYVISPYSGQVIIYSTVKGKVTSGSKRLEPSIQTGATYYGRSYTKVTLSNGEGTVNTPEIMGDDGTYGSSGDYLYWWDAKGIYHQHYLTGGQIVHISDQPLSVKSVIINMEQQ